MVTQVVFVYSLAVNSASWQPELTTLNEIRPTGKAPRLPLFAISQRGMGDFTEPYS